MHAGEELKVIHLGYPAETPFDAASRNLKATPAAAELIETEEIKSQSASSPPPPLQATSTSIRPRASVPMKSRPDADTAKTESFSADIKKPSKRRLPPRRHDAKLKMAPEETRAVEEAPEVIERKGAADGSSPVDGRSAAVGRDTPQPNCRMKASEAERIDAGSDDREAPAETLLSLSIQVELWQQIVL